MILLIKRVDDGDSRKTEDAPICYYKVREICEDNLEITCKDPLAISGYEVEDYCIGLPHEQFKGFYFFICGSGKRLYCHDGRWAFV